MSKLTKLTIKKFRNVVPTTLEFRPGLNVVLGKNAAGKTTLLRLLSTALGNQEEALKDEELEVSYRGSGRVLDFEHSITRTRLNVPKLPLDLVESFSNFQQTDRFLFERSGGVLLTAEVLPNEVVINRLELPQYITPRVGGGPISSVLFALANVSLDDRAAALGIGVAESSVSSAGRMDESLERFGALLRVRGEDSGGRMRWSMEAVPRSMFAVPWSQLQDGTSSMVSLGFLDRGARVLGYDSAQARFDVERFSPEPSRQVVRVSNPRFFFKRPGEEISHDLLSYGQKRLLSFFAHVDASPDVLIADELVNGLHHEWISACLNEIGDRQAFLTSQNPLLLDFLRFESAEEVRRTFILCERENRENGAQLIWRNPTEEEAESFFSAYQTGIQRVSDILLTKGLW